VHISISYFSDLTDCRGCHEHMHIYNRKTVARTYFLVGSYIIGRVHRSRTRSFLEGSRSLCKVTSYSSPVVIFHLQ